MSSNFPSWYIEVTREQLATQLPEWYLDKFRPQSPVSDDEVPTPTFEARSGPSVDEIASGIVTREGGFVDDPDDPGGVTNFGVTIGTMRKLGIDLNEDGKINEADVKLMTAEKAQSIFTKEFFKKPGIDKLPEELQATVFDMQVNSGANAIRILQETVNQFGGDLVVDGVIGSKTVTAVEEAYRRMGSELVNEYGVARRDYYYGLADARTKSRKFARTQAGGKGGWIKRAEEFLPKELHFTREQHAERTAGWL